MISYIAFNKSGAQDAKLLEEDLVGEDQASETLGR